jgi:hypothetical protein
VATLLRDAVCSSLIRELPCITPSAYVLSLDCDFHALHFVCGWSFEEQTEDGTGYRWLFRGVQGAIRLPGLSSGQHTVELKVLAFANGCTPSQVSVSLDHAEPCENEVIEQNGRWILRYRFATQARTRATLLNISVGSTSKRGGPDPRDDLSLALTGIYLSSNIF